MAEQGTFADLAWASKGKVIMPPGGEVRPVTARMGRNGLIPADRNLNRALISTISP